MEKLLTVSDVARRLNLTPAAIRALERRGDLLAIRTAGEGQHVRLFREVDVKEFAERRRVRRSRPSKVAP